MPAGPINQITWDKNKYFVAIIDDFTHFVRVFLMSSKSEVFKYFNEYKEASETHFETKIPIIRSDNGGEYTSKYKSSVISKKWASRLKSQFHIIHRKTRYERMNRTLLEKPEILFSIEICGQISLGRGH